LSARLLIVTEVVTFTFSQKHRGIAEF